MATSQVKSGFYYIRYILRMSRILSWKSKALSQMAKFQVRFGLYHTRLIFKMSRTLLNTPLLWSSKTSFLHVFPCHASFLQNTLRSGMSRYSVGGTPIAHNQKTPACLSYFLDRKKLMYLNFPC